MPTIDTTDRVASVRAFNRFYTRVLGLLDEGLAHTAYTLTEARVLFEVAHHDPVAVPELRGWLGLDAGYLSRILAQFESDDLIVRERSTEDARRQLARLTPLGRKAFAELDTRQADEVRTLLTSVSEPGQRRLVDAMRSIESLLSESGPPTEPILRAPAPGELGWVVQRHGALYAEEYDWDETFEALVARIVADFVEQYDAARDRAWIAEVDGEPVGSVFCAHKDGDDTTAQLRLLLVEPTARGLGVGSRLVDACLDFARDAGYRELVLWTNSVLAAARRIYQRAGFELVDESPNPSFGKQLTAQNWRRDL